MLGACDAGARARFATALQQTYGNAYLQRLAKVTGPTLQRSGPPVVSPGSPNIPGGFEEYKVTEEMIKMLERVAKGEVTAQQAESELAKAAARRAAAEAGASSLAAALPPLLGIALASAAVIAPNMFVLGEARAEREVGDAIVAATSGYVAGFMSGVGWSMSGGDQRWFADAKGKGAAAKDLIVAKVKANPALKDFDIGPDEVMLVITQGKESFHRALYAQVKPQIASGFIDSWKKGISRWRKFFNPNIEKTGERNIRTRAGLPDQGALPEPKISGPSTAPS